MIVHFATLFDINYLSRGLSLYDSLQKCVGDGFKLYVLCLDELVQNFFFTNPSYQQVRCITLEELESQFLELKIAKKNRSAVEYYFTLSPYLPLYILKSFKEVDRITTMDADLFFFDNPTQIFTKYSTASVLITPHNFSKENIHELAWGKYNVSFQSFKRDEHAIKCLEHWREKCLEWCYDTLDVENRRFADQKYLDEWEELFPFVESIDMKGAGVAPWNINNFNFTGVNNKVLVDGEPLIYYHFQHLRIFSRDFASHGLRTYHSNISKWLKHIYHTYLLQVKKNDQENRENQILRNSYNYRQTLLNRLLKTDGYFFFTDFFIISVNFYSSYKKLRNRLKKHG